MREHLGETKTIRYLKDTELRRDSIKADNALDVGRAEPFKTYPEAKKISLPRARWRLHEARIIPLMQQRRSRRSFSSEPVDPDGLAFLLWCSQGLTAQAGKHYLRTAPSAGALYPIESYVSVQNVEGITSGLYHFDPVSFQLELLVARDIRTEVSRAFLNQRFMERAAVNIIWTAIPKRSLTKYGERGGRYVMMDVAHICQNTLLAAEALDYGGCPVAAFYDQEVNKMLEIDGVEETAVYAVSIGRKTQSVQSEKK